MAETAIEWATHSWNPTTGCDRVTRGCRNCYALRMAGRAKLMGNARYQLDGDSKSSGPGFGLQMWEDRLAEPARWRKPRVVFVDSMSDLFHPEVTDEFIWRVWKAMAGASRHTFLVLTKRPDRMRELVNSWHRGVDARGQKFVTQPLPNVWLGTSIENRHVVKRAEELRQTLAARRFISAEPLVGALSGLSLEAIDWLIVGGESGPGAVPMHPLWARSLRDACLDSTCPLCAGAVDVGGWHCPRCAGTGRETLFFFKQWGAFGPQPSKRPFVVGENGRHYPASEHHRRTARQPSHGDPYVVFKSNKKAQGRVLDGTEWDERPPLAHELADRALPRARTTPDTPEAAEAVVIDRRQPA
jgi:protein gp37